MTNSPNIRDAQREMRFAYLGGAPGVIVSAAAWLAAGIVAVELSPLRSIWVLFVIGGRYLTFATIYGTRLYWWCGAALAVAGCALGRAMTPPAPAAFAGAAIEAACAVIVFASARRVVAGADDGERR